MSAFEERMWRLETSLAVQEARSDRLEHRVREMEKRLDEAHEGLLPAFIRGRLEECGGIGVGMTHEERIRALEARARLEVRATENTVEGSAPHGGVESHSSRHQKPAGMPLAAEGSPAIEGEVAARAAKADDGVKDSPSPASLAGEVPLRVSESFAFKGDYIVWSGIGGIATFHGPDAKANAEAFAASRLPRPLFRRARCPYCAWTGEYRVTIEEINRDARAHGDTCAVHPRRALERRIAELEASRLPRPLFRRARCPYCAWTGEYRVTIEEINRDARAHGDTCAVHPRRALERRIAELEASRAPLPAPQPFPAFVTDEWRKIKARREHLAASAPENTVEGEDARKGMSGVGQAPVATPSTASPAGEVLYEWHDDRLGLALRVVGSDVFWRVPEYGSWHLCKDTGDVGDAIRRRVVALASRAPRPAPQPSVEEMAERIYDANAAFYATKPLYVWADAEGRRKDYFRVLARAALSALPAPDEKPIDVLTLWGALDRMGQSKPTFTIYDLERALNELHHKTTQEEGDLRDECDDTTCPCHKFTAPDAPKPASEAQGEPTLEECQRAAIEATRKNHPNASDLALLLSPDEAAQVAAVRSLCLASNPYAQQVDELQHEQDRLCVLLGRGCQRSEIHARVTHLLDSLSAAEEALPEGIQVDREHTLAECIERIASRAPSPEVCPDCGGGVHARGCGAASYSPERGWRDA